VEENQEAGLFVQSFASGSSGNCYLVSCQQTVLLLDAGISCRSIVGALRLNNYLPVDVDGVLITHEHADHIKGVQVLSRRTPAKFFASHPTWGAMDRLGIEVDPQQRQCFAPGDSWELGGARIFTFSVYHDSVDCVGYVVEDIVTGQRVGLVTDTGGFDQQMIDCLQGCHLLIVESNHDPDMLARGPYPAFLKRRIAGGRGHLSNQAGAQLVDRVISPQTQRVWLAHLSHENNSPDLALAAVKGILAPRQELGQQLPHIQVVPRAMLGPVYPEEKLLSLC